MNPLFHKLSQYLGWEKYFDEAYTETWYGSYSSSVVVIGFRDELQPRFFRKPVIEERVPFKFEINNITTTNNANPEFHRTKGKEIAAEWIKEITKYLANKRQSEAICNRLKDALLSPYEHVKDIAIRDAIQFLETKKPTSTEEPPTV